MSIINKCSQIAEIVKECNQGGETQIIARVKDIIVDGEIIDKDTYMLKPQGMVYIVSDTYFEVGPSQCGIIMLDDGYSKRGLLCLNSGFIEPHYNGPISSIVINFSNKHQKISKNSDSFFRVLLFELGEDQPNSQ